MYHDEVFTAGLAYNSRVRAIFIDILANGLPNVLEHLRTSRKVDSGKIGVAENHLTGSGAADIHQVNYPGRQPRFHKYLHKHFGRINLGIGGFPHNGIAHHGCRTG